MAAIDPTEGPDLTVSSIDYPTPRATLKMIRKVGAPCMDGINDEDDDDSEDEDDLKALLNGDDDMGSSGDEEDEEVNGGPSDPSKSKKARQEAAIESLRTAFEAGNDDEDMMLGGLNGDSMSMNKGKGIANGLDMEDSDEDDDSDDEWDEFVICTLDTTHVSQPYLFLT
jgi:FK506-binding nuclear protein